jgi:anaerobic carbon-monoxide dehydrogenase iron sulfur subunit
MADMIFVVDVAKCTACQKCEIACAGHNVKEMNAARARIAIFPRPTVQVRADGAWWGAAGRAVPGEGVRESPPLNDAAGTPVTCLQCDDAACVRVCQVGALVRNPVTGAIEVDQARCVRCKMCVPACPFGNMTWDEPLGQVAKCDLCHGMPQCALACPSGALKYRPAAEVAMPAIGVGRGGR